MRDARTCVAEKSKRNYQQLTFKMSLKSENEYILKEDIEGYLLFFASSGENVQKFEKTAKRFLKFRYKYFMEKESIVMKKKQFFFVSFFVCEVIMVLIFSGATLDQAIPNQLKIEVGSELEYDFGVPITVEFTEESREAFAQGYRPGLHHSYTVSCRLLGLFPIKDIEVTYVEGNAVFSSGKTIGIYAKTDGVLVIGNGKITLENGEEVCPSENLLHKGDYILSVNGEKITEKEELASLIDIYGTEKEILGVKRNEEYIEVAITPVEAKAGQYMLGVWVRDDLAGIGTMTYYDETGRFGALGHPISDGDIGDEILLKNGKIYETDIIGVRKGASGTPGEISGVINYHADYRLGTLEANEVEGIFGRLDGNLENFARGEYYQIAYKQDIELGKAYLLSDVSGELKSYEIEIQSLDYSNKEINKGITIKVTDRELLELTGGIIQGMSGSPVIQNGRIVGAVTHVLVNDPTRGYGIFIENMLEHN